MSQSTDAALGLLLRAARETATARRIGGDSESALLQSVVDAAATIFAAEASSIALFEPDPDRLVFRVAGGVQGDGVVGLGRAGITKDVPAGAVVSGMPARPHVEMNRRRALAAKLPALVERVRELERQLAALRENQADRGAT